mmetsp:Transcript_131453/g.327792  ORF Transcript_131453/g.327792 Transcript_131453/m.327792 type:complete len:590 (+) Transcript_131453:77-1846(+)
MFPLAVVPIILVEFCERLCYYTFSGTQKTWLQDRGYSNSQSSSLNLTWAMLSYVACFFGGWLASSKAGIFMATAALSLLYAVGTYLAAYAALPSVESIPLYLFGVFFLITLGAGGIKPNVCTMGANQFDPEAPNANEQRASFFMYFYLTINVGSAISHGVLSSWASSGAPSLGVSLEYGYFFAWTVAASFMALAFLFFVLGRCSYRKVEQKKEEPVLSMMFETLLAGSGSPMGKLALLGWGLIPVVIAVAFVNAFVENGFLKVAAIVVALACIGSLVAAHWDNSYLPEGGIRMCLDCVPILLVGNLFFNILQSTIGSVFLSEACQMDTRTDRSDFSVEGFQRNGDFFRLANPIAIVVVTPLMDFVIYPLVKRATGREVSMAMKVIAGFSFAIGAQLIAAAIEYQRRSDPVLSVPSHCAPYIMVEDSTGHVGMKEPHEHVHMSATNSFYMLAPYAMVGIGEILVNPVLQHLAYEGAPPEMRSLLQAFNLFAMGALPNAVASSVSQALKAQVPNDLNDGNLPVVYFINSVIGLVGILCFFVVFHFAPERLKDSHGKDCRDVSKSSAKKENDTEDETTDGSSSFGSSDVDVC